MLPVSKKCHLTVFSTGRGETVRRFLIYRGPRRLKRRYATEQ